MRLSNTASMKTETTLLLKQIEEHLDNLTTVLVSDLVRIGQGELNNRIKGFDFGHVKVLYFEYSYDDLQLYFWEEGIDEQLLSHAAVNLPAIQIEGLLPLELRGRMFDLEDVLYEDVSIDDDAVEEELEQFNAARCALFEQWFIACWSQARKQMTWDKQAYFSVHDSYYKTKLD